MPMSKQKTVLVNPQQKRGELEKLLGLANESDVKSSHMRKFMNSLYEDQFSLEPWVNDLELIPDDTPQKPDTSAVSAAARKASIFGSFGVLQSATKKVHPNVNTVQRSKEIELGDINIFRDLAPYSRKLKLSKEKGYKHIQKKFLKNFKLQMIAKQKSSNAAAQQFLSEEKYHLTLANILPLEKCNHQYTDQYSYCKKGERV